LRRPQNIAVGPNQCCSDVRPTRGGQRRTACSNADHALDLNGFKVVTAKQYEPRLGELVEQRGPCRVAEPELRCTSTDDGMSIVWTRVPNSQAGQPHRQFVSQFRDPTDEFVHERSKRLWRRRESPD